MRFLAPADRTDTLNAARLRQFDLLMNQRWQNAQEAVSSPPGCFTLTWDVGDYPHFRQKRGYAVTIHAGPTCCHIRVAAKMLSAEDHRADGVLRHELGHVLDMLIPPVELDVWASRRGILLPKTPERRADAVAQAVWGTPIHYDQDLVQSTRHGTYPRPRHLGL
jgi:hypothetical protein